MLAALDIAATMAARASCYFDANSNDAQCFLSTISDIMAISLSANAEGIGAFHKRSAGQAVVFRLL